MEDIRILTAGDSSLLIEFGHEINPEINRKIKSMVELMKEQHIEGVLDVIPAFCSCSSTMIRVSPPMRRSHGG